MLQQQGRGRPPSPPPLWTRFEPPSNNSESKRANYRPTTTHRYFRGNKNQRVEQSRRRAREMKEENIKKKWAEIKKRWIFKRSTLKTRIKHLKQTKRHVTKRPHFHLSEDVIQLYFEMQLFFLSRSLFAEKDNNIFRKKKIKRRVSEMFMQPTGATSTKFMTKQPPTSWS